MVPPARHEIAALSYIAAGGFFAFKADGNADAGPEHLNFKLAAEPGAIGLFAPDLSLIDLVLYGPQSTGISEGRSPNGASSWPFSTRHSRFRQSCERQRRHQRQCNRPQRSQADNRSLSEQRRHPHGLGGVIQSLHQHPEPRRLQPDRCRRTPRRWVFPSGVTVAPGTFLVVRCDPHAPASTSNGPVLNTGFRTQTLQAKPFTSTTQPHRCLTPSHLDRRPPIFPSAACGMAQQSGRSRWPPGVRPT